MREEMEERMAVVVGPNDMFVLYVAKYRIPWDILSGGIP